MEPDLRKDSVNTRIVFISTGIGYPNVLSVCSGFQIDNYWSVGAKLSLFNNKNRAPGIYFGNITYGVKISRFFNKSLLDYLNNCSLEIGYYDYKDSNGRYKQQSSIELTLGKDNNSSNTISLGYQLGLALITTSFSAPLFSPCAQIFITLNF